VMIEEIAGRLLATI